MNEGCGFPGEEITAYVFDSGALEERARARVEEHLRNCAACRREAERLEALRAAAAELPRIPPSRGFGERVLRALEMERTLGTLSVPERLQLALGSVLYTARRSPAARFLLLAAAIQFLLFTLLYFASGVTVQVAPSGGSAGAVRRVRPPGGSAGGGEPPVPVTDFLPEGAHEARCASGERLDAPSAAFEPPRPLEAPIPDTVLKDLDERIERENRLELTRCRMDARFSIPCRKRILRKRGGDPRTAAAVERGLRWLRDHQRKDGSWPVGGPFGGDPRVTPGITALAAAAFLSDGHTERTGRFAGAVRRALEYLLSVQDREGRFGWVEGAPLESIFNQAASVLALSENYVLCEDGGRRAPLERGIAALVRMAEKGTTSSASDRRFADAWAALALRTAALTGLAVPGLEGAAGRLEARVARLAGDEEPGGGAERLADLPPICTATSLALEALFREPAPRPREAGGVPFPDPDRPATLYAFLDDPAYREPSFLFFTGTALCGRDASLWEPWNRKVKVILLEEQSPEGEWPARGRWPWIDGGDLYTTALDLLTLQVYYRYVRLEEGSRD